MSKQKKFFAPLRMALALAGILCAGRSATSQTLFLSTSSAGAYANSLQSVATNGMGESALVTSGASDHYVALAVDSVHSNLFVGDSGINAVVKFTLGGGNLGTVVSTASQISGVAVDPVNNFVYYTTSSATGGNNSVMRVGYDGSGLTSIFSAANEGGISRCTALAVDPLNGYIFVGDAGIGGIWSMNLSGGNLTLLASGLPGAPLDVAVDPQNQLLYFVTSSATLTNNTVEHIHYNGGAPTILFTASGAPGPQRCTSLDLDLANGIIYFSDAASASLFTLPASGGTATLIASNLSDPTVKKVRLFAPSSSIGIGSPSYSSLVLSTPDLLGYWPFSTNTQANSYGDGYTGTFEANAAIGGPNSGPSLLNMPGNTALVLDGTDSFVNTSLTGGLLTNGPNADQGSIIAWINLATLPSTVGRFFTIAGESQYGNDLDFQIETDNRLKFFTDAGSSTVDPIPFTSANLNSWIFVAATFTSNVTRSVYVNGVQMATSAPGGPHNPATGGTFAIGESDVFTGRYFQGSIDEVAVFNRALSSTEISNLYAAGVGSTIVSLNIQKVGTNVVLTWNDPAAVFKLQSTTNLTGAFTNVAGALSPFQPPAIGPGAFYRLSGP